MNIATAYVQVIPSLRGADKVITRELGGVDLSGTGRKMGKGLGDGIGSGLGDAGGFSAKMSALTGAVAGFAMEIGGRAIDAVANLAGEMVEASDSSQKFASTLDFAGIDTSTIDKLIASTQKYADQTVYDLADIRNVTAQLAANGVDNYAQLAEAAGNLNAVAGGNADTFRSVSMVMSQTAGAGKLMTENWNQLTDAIPGASGALQEAMRSAGAFEGNFREAMENGEISADEFFAAVQKLGMQDVAVQAATSTSTIEGALGNLQASVVGVGSQLITALNPAITGTMNALTGVISGIPSLLSTYGPQLAAFFDPLIAGAKMAADFAVPALQGLAASVAPLVTTLGTALQPVLGAIVTLIGRAVMAIGQVTAVLAPMVEQVVSFVSGTILPVVMPAIQSIVSTVQTAMPLITTAISAALEAIQAVWNVVWPALQAVVVPIMQGISGIISSVMTAIQGVINVVLGIINGDWSTVWTGIQQLTQGVMGFIDSIVSSGISTVQGVIDSALGVIQSIWNGAWNALGDLLNGAWNGFVEIVSGGNEDVMNLLRDLPGKIIGAFAGAGSWLIDAGRSIINGLLDGLKGAWDDVTGFIGGLGDWIVSHKGPPSYDAVMLVENGELIMRGLLRGMQRGWGDVEDYVNGRGLALSASMDYGAPRAYAASYSGDAASVEAILLAIYRALPGMIRDNSPSALTVDGREFARAVRRYA